MEWYFFLCVPLIRSPSAGISFAEGNGAVLVCYIKTTENQPTIEPMANIIPWVTCRATEWIRVIWRSRNIVWTKAKPNWIWCLSRHRRHHHHRHSQLHWQVQEHTRKLAGLGGAHLVIVAQRFSALVIQHVSERLLHCIDANFGHTRADSAAINAKIVYLSMVDGHQTLCKLDIVQLFSHPHPLKQYQTVWTSNTPPRSTQKIRIDDDKAAVEVCPINTWRTMPIERPSLNQWTHRHHHRHVHHYESIRRHTINRHNCQQ